MSFLINPRHGTASSRSGFTLTELLVVVVILAILGTITLSGWRWYRGLATGAQCSSNLRQLGTAVSMYTSDNNGYFPAYVINGTKDKRGQRTWFFGHESTPAGTPEGERDLDVTAGPLYPYVQAVGKIEVCQGFNYEAALWKAKFKGASYGYGYNWWLGGRITGIPMHVTQVSSPARVILFGDCGQINTFQKPASPTKPMIEEFYILSESESTVHFRHGTSANMLFVDGHVQAFKPHPGTADTRVKGETVGRIAAPGDTRHFK